MAPPSSLPDSHGDDVLELITRLLTLEYERGKLTAQREFHLKVRSVAIRHVEEATPEPEKPEKPEKRESRRQRKPGQLEDEIIEDLAKCGALTTREIAHHVEANQESVRQTISRLIKQARVVREGTRKYRLSRSNEGAEG